jgi:hypothetical protein
MARKLECQPGPRCFRPKSPFLTEASSRKALERESGGSIVFAEGPDKE